MLAWDCWHEQRANSLLVNSTQLPLTSGLAGSGGRRHCFADNRCTLRPSDPSSPTFRSRCAGRQPLSPPIASSQAFARAAAAGLTASPSSSRIARLRNDMARLDNASKTNIAVWRGPVLLRFKKRKTAGTARTAWHGTPCANKLPATPLCCVQRRAHPRHVSADWNGGRQAAACSTVDVCPLEPAGAYRQAQPLD